MLSSGCVSYKQIMVTVRSVHSNRQCADFMKRMNGEVCEGEIWEMDVNHKRTDYLSWDEYFMGVAMMSGMRDRKSTRLNSSHEIPSRMPSSA